jgi:hypothetical protein
MERRGWNDVLLVQPWSYDILTVTIDVIVDHSFMGSTTLGTRFSFFVLRNKEKSCVRSRELMGADFANGTRPFRAWFIQTCFNTTKSTSVPFSPKSYRRAFPFLLVRVRCSIMFLWKSLFLQERREAQNSAVYLRSHFEYIIKVVRHLIAFRWIWVWPVTKIFIRVPLSPSLAWHFNRSSVNAPEIHTINEK